MSEKMRVYAMALRPETMDYARTRRFSRITKRYILILSDEKPGMDAIEVADEDRDALTVQDCIWLEGCLVRLLAEELSEKQDDVLCAIGERVDRLEEALKNAAEGGTDT